MRLFQKNKMNAMNKISEKLLLAVKMQRPTEALVVELAGLYKSIIYIVTKNYA